ncbi:TRAP transporter substrate-binding protein [Allopontixanthobacter sediminis]|uniref:DctP family TRAP transporter solute-binding subunit n=1 Tax=Allopontixanthobacter sediminis TaxID=1689985 RepID=A0A845B1B7_9SPHN|nr:TRAP transporter substrate-binding protein [Allopontixanthobacter sediminis]MXP44048.1 DctP family TRAP transporter solute-binding subunit [Allopontixanthobacter sediminis]
MQRGVNPTPRLLSASRRTVLAGGAALLASCGMRLSNVFTAADTHPTDYPTVQAVDYLGQLLAERTGGRLGAKVYAGGQLGNERDTLEITTFGGLDLNRVNAAPLNSIEPLTIPICLPFVFGSVDHMRRTLDGDVGEEILASLTRHGLIGLCYYDSGARSFYNSRGPIQSPEDMKGLKLRVPGSDLYIGMVRALGADPVPMPLDEVYQSLAQGVIDGAENNWPSLESGRHYEAAPFYSLTEHLFTPEVLVMSKISWDKLSPEDKQVMRRSAKDSVPYMRNLWDAREASSREVILAAGVEVNTVDPAPFTELMTGMWDEFLTTPQQHDLVERILAQRES